MSKIYEKIYNLWSNKFHYLRTINMSMKNRKIYYSFVSIIIQLIISVLKK